jgi:protein TonB
MWQFAMNSPGNGDVRRVNRLLALACFTAIAALHIAFLSAFDFFGKNERRFMNTRELTLSFDFTDNKPQELSTETAPELPLPAAPLAREASLPEPVSEEIPLPREEIVSGVAPRAEPETVFPVAAAFSAPVEGASVYTGNSVLSGVSSAPVRKNPMTEAEYLALIMSRLVDNKIYPLSVRKRGIEGDITVNFTIKRDGTVSDISLADPSGHRFLAQAAFETIRSASPFPVMEGRDGDYTALISIQYRLKDQTNPEN